MIRNFYMVNVKSKVDNDKFLAFGMVFSPADYNAVFFASFSILGDR